MVGDGEGMQSANYSQDTKCWSCDDHDSLELVEGVNEQVRLGAFLRSIPPSRHVGDYAHATARLCTATQKRVQQDVFRWVQEGDSLGVIGRLKDVWGDCMHASNNIRQADRVALRPTKKDAFDLTFACVFIDDTQRIVGLLNDYYGNRKASNGAIKVYIVVHTMLLALGHFHTLWRTKDCYLDVGVEKTERWAQTLGQC